jgi:hypothetical protein
LRTPLRALAETKKPTRIASLSMGAPASHGYLMAAFRNGCCADEVIE